MKDGRITFTEGNSTGRHFVTIQEQAIADCAVRHHADFLRIGTRCVEGRVLCVE